MQVNKFLEARNTIRNEVSALRTPGRVRDAEVLLEQFVHEPVPELGPARSSSASSQRLQLKATPKSVPSG